MTTTCNFFTLMLNFWKSLSNYGRIKLITSLEFILAFVSAADLIILFVLCILHASICCFQLIPMTDIQEVLPEFQKLNRTENCIILQMKNDTKIAITSPVGTFPVIFCDGAIRIFICFGDVIVYFCVSCHHKGELAESVTLKYFFYQ